MKPISLELKTSHNPLYIRVSEIFVLTFELKSGIIRTLSETKKIIPSSNEMGIGAYIATKSVSVITKQL